MRLGRKQCPMKIELPGSARAVSPRGRPRRLLRRSGPTECGSPRGFLRSSIDSESSVVTAQTALRQKKEVARADPPPLRRGRPKPSRVGVGWGRIFDWHLPQADEALVVKGDGPEVPGRLNGLRRLHIDRDRVVVRLLDLAGRVLDLFRQRRQVGSAQVLDDALDDRDDHVRDDLNRRVEGDLVGEAVERVVVEDDDAVRLLAERLEALPGDLGPALGLERQDRDPDGHGAIRARRAGDDRGRPGPGSTSEARDDEHDIRRERSPTGAFLVLGGSARPGDTVLVLAVREEDLYIALRLRQPRGVRVHSDRLDALDIAIVERAHHLAAGSADADHRDLRVHGVLEQAADDLVHKVLASPRFRPPTSSVDLSKEAGRPFARGEECIPSLLSGSHSFFPSLPWRLLPSGVRHARVLHGGMTPSFSPVETATTLPVTLSTSCLWSWISFTRSRVNQSSTLRTTACSRLRK